MLQVDGVLPGLLPDMHFAILERTLPWSEDARWALLGHGATAEAADVLLSCHSS